MPHPNPPISYSTLVSLFTTHLTIAIHTILASRHIYPSTTFLQARAYNLPIMQSRHPGVCQWINDAVAAVEAELLKGGVLRVALVIWEAWWEGDAPAHSSEESGQSERIEGARPLERYVWDVSRWPEVPKSEVHTPFTRRSADTQTIDASPRAEQPVSDEERRAQFQGALKQAHSDLHEQFRALLSRLQSIGERLQPLPCGADRCTYTVAVELKEEADPPIGHPQAWVPSEKGMQRRIAHGDDAEESGARREKEGGRLLERGQELGGAKTTPVRTVDSGEMVFEMWIEEGKAKFDNKYTRPKSSADTAQASSNG